MHNAVRSEANVEMPKVRYYFWLLEVGSEYLRLRWAPIQKNVILSHEICEYLPSTNHF